MRKKIEELKKSKNAVILAHNYQLPEIQEVADFVGDSLELAIRAKDTNADIIVLCGVLFMAETAKLLNPEKKVLIPATDAGCPLADQLSPKMIIEARKKYPGAAVVVYVNSSAECKAEADITCTSGNAEKIVRSLKEQDILFGPDSNLAAYVQRIVPEKRIIPLPPGGHCPVHMVFRREDVLSSQKNGGLVICHPECLPEVQELSDYIASTGGMAGIVKGGSLWHIFTEEGMGFRLKTLYPDKEFIIRDDAVCRDMKKITIDQLLRSLEEEIYEISIPPEIMERAAQTIERMISVK